MLPGSQFEMQIWELSAKVVIFSSLTCGVLLGKVLREQKKIPTYINSGSEWEKDEEIESNLSEKLKFVIYKCIWKWMYMLKYEYGMSAFQFSFNKYVFSALSLR